MKVTVKIIMIDEYINKKSIAASIIYSDPGPRCIPSSDNEGRRVRIPSTATSLKSPPPHLAPAQPSSSSAPPPSPPPQRLGLLLLLLLPPPLLPAPAPAGRSGRMGELKGVAVALS